MTTLQSHQSPRKATLRTTVLYVILSLLGIGGRDQRSAHRVPRETLAKSPSHCTERTNVSHSELGCENCYKTSRFLPLEQ